MVSIWVQKKEILGIWLNSFSALTLFVWWQAGHLASKKLSGAGMVICLE